MERCKTNKFELSMLNRFFTMVVLLGLVNTSCSQNRTYLTEQEKAWNPYIEGQVLVFGTSGGNMDTLVITRVEDKRFPDGIGALQNERLRVLVKIKNSPISTKPIEVMLIYIYSKTAKDPSDISFEIPLAGGKFFGKAYPIDELEKYAEFSLQTQSGIFNDVIRIDDNSNQDLREEDIATIFWSKSAGFVRCIEKDGTVWELISVR
jgi:hypothetical protein